MEYLRDREYEPYGSVIELSLKEGQKERLALKLPEYAEFSLDPEGKEKLSLETEYSYDEEVCYLSLHALEEGQTRVYVSLANEPWMEIGIEILMNPYYRVPQWESYEDYGSEQSFSLVFGGEKPEALSLKLPENATFTYTLHKDGESLQESELSVAVSCKEETGEYILELNTELYSGEAVFSFYIDEIYWCKATVSFQRKTQPKSNGQPSISYEELEDQLWDYSYSINQEIAENYKQHSNSSNSKGKDSNSSWEYDYLSKHSGCQSAIPGASIPTASGPIIVIGPVFTENGQMINPGVYWP